MVKQLPILTLGLSLILSLTAWADDPPAVLATPKVTLAQTLAAVPTPDEGIVMTVGAEKVTLPDGATLPPIRASLNDCAVAFGRMTQTFGPVTALAPDTMTLLNDQPGDPDLSADLNPFQAFEELAASLSDSQWQELTSEAGLGLSDLMDDRQRTLFWAQFPHRTLKVVPITAVGKSSDPETATDVSASLPQIHLRLGQTATLSVPKRGAGYINSPAPPEPNSVPHWAVFQDDQMPQAEQKGVPLRADVPNTLKDSDLRYDQRAFQMKILLGGLKTVGDLVLRVRQTTGLELYADRHYESRTLTLLGPVLSVPAGDLLRALTLCVTGTFRRVGPAYVLTDDLPGVGVLHQVWSEYNSRINELSSKSVNKARQALSDRRSVFDLPSFGDILAPTRTQETRSPETSMGHFFPQVPELLAEVPFSSLTPSQQKIGRQFIEAYTASHIDEIAKDPAQAPNINGKWLVSPRCVLQALVPGLSQPVEIRKSSLAGLVFPPDDVLQSWEKQMAKWDNAQAAKKKAAKPLPTLAVLLAHTSRRAVLADPRSPAEVRALVTSMQKLGLNQLWLYVFEDGLARIPDTPFLQPLESKGDLLGAALQATKDTDITVFPVLSLLTWGQSPPTAMQDVNVLGKTSVQINDQQKKQLHHDLDDTTPPGVSVSPFAPDVWTDLTALVKRVAARPGVGGIVWRQTDPTGYDNATDNTGSLHDQLGYTPAARLAFLRQSHADPLDITTNDYSHMDFHLPNWDDVETESKLQKEWSAFRAAPDMALLRSLYATAQAAAPAGSISILVHTRRTEEWIGDWYGTWDTPFLLPPTYHGGAETGDYEPGFETSALTQAKTQSQTAIATIIVKLDDESDDLALRLNSILNDTKGKHWDGFVLDVATGDGGPGALWLDTLTK